MGWWIGLETQSRLTTKSLETCSKHVPNACPCCGTDFDADDHRIRGPYRNSLYAYVCNSCWEKTYLFFPDKTYGSLGFQQFSETLIYHENQGSSQPSQKDESMAKTRAQVLTQSTLKGAELVRAPLTKLRFDPNNIRLRYLGKLRDEELEEAIWSEPLVEEWYRLIRADGGITEPLVIDSKYVVREGNERLACLRRLSKEAHNGEIPEFPKNRFDLVPCQKIPPNFSEREIAIWLARIHYKGKHPWKSVNKALMIYELSTKHGFTYEEIRKRLGVSKKTVQTTRSAYEATLQYHDEHRDDTNWYYKYSYYHEIYRTEKLKNWIRENDHSRLFADWIYSGKIPRGEDVRKLKGLIDDPEILAEFSTTNVTRAKEILRAFESGGSKSLNVLAKAKEELRKFPLGELRTVVSDPMKWKIIDELHKELESFIKNAESVKES